MDTDIQIDYRGFIKSKITGNSHTLDTALSELIHNSISAKASDIFILHNDFNKPIIIDNGTGMNKDNMDKLKKFYDSSKREIGDIGTYNIGLKEALLKIGGRWIILSKTKNTEDIVYCDFNSDNLTKFAYGEPYINCIDSGFCNKLYEKLFINILDEIGLINKNKSTSLKKFSGTVIYQIEDNNQNEPDENNIFYNTLYTNLKLKLSQYNCNFKYGTYTTNNNIINIDDTSIKTLSKLDWLQWNNTNNNTQLEFNIIPYKTKKNILFAIEYLDKIYKFNKSKSIFDTLANIDTPLEKINIKCNIVTHGQHIKQELYFKELNYTRNINGIIISRNGLNLYDFPNKWDNSYIKDTTNRKYARIYVSFLGNDALDTIFNILPNKSLFITTNVNSKLKYLLELIKEIIYEYLDVSLQNSISLKTAFKYVLQNIDLTNIQHKFNLIQGNWTRIFNNYDNLHKIQFLQNLQKYNMCKKIYLFYKNNKIKVLQNTFNTINYKYNMYKTSQIYLQKIILIQKKYKFLRRFKIFQKLYLCLHLSKYFKYQKKYLYTYYFYNIQNNFYNENNLYIKFNKTINKILYKIKLNHIKLMIYLTLSKRIQKSIFI